MTIQTSEDAAIAILATLGLIAAIAIIIVGYTTDKRNTK